MKRRRPIRTAVLLIGLCLTLWRLPSTIETFAATMGAGGSPTQSLMAALSSAAGAGGVTTAEAQQKKEPSVFAAGGRELSDEEREQLLRRARAMAPLPLDGKKAKPGEAQTPANQQAALAELQKQLDDAMKLKNPG